MQIAFVDSPEAWAGLNPPAEALAYIGANPFLESPTRLIAALNTEGSLVACCGVWAEVRSPEPNRKAGAIGHFFASSPETGAALLEVALRELAAVGCQLAIGPMNGNTWRRYRFALEMDDTSDPPFFLEPSNPTWWPGLWQEQGFRALAGYHSSAIDDLQQSDPRAERASVRLKENGVSIRPIDTENLEADLRKTYQLTLESFASNYLYTPLPEKAFLGMYLPLKDRIDPRFALLAAGGDEIVGYVFSLPDFNQLSRGQQPDTLIIKTLATKAGRAYAGLGVVLVERMREAAQNAGMRRIVHALMHDGNVSANIGRSSRILRRYALYAKELP